jgi:hypothetical protein
VLYNLYFISQIDNLKIRVDSLNRNRGSSWSFETGQALIWGITRSWSTWKNPKWRQWIFSFGAIEIIVEVDDSCYLWMDRGIFVRWFPSEQMNTLAAELSLTYIEILGHFSLAHTRFQKFLEISKPMCVSPFVMQPKFLAAQRQVVGAKLSPTWEVGRDVDQHIRWSVVPLGKWVRREVPPARSSSSLDSTRARVAVCGIEPRSRAYLFAAQEKPNVWPSPWRTHHS